MDFNFSQFFLLLLFLMVAAKHSLFWTAVWQIKEYRFDRFWDYLCTPEGKRSIFNKATVLEFLALVLTLAFFNSAARQLIIAGVFLSEAVLVVWHFKSQTFIKPSFTAKACLIFIASVFFALVIAGFVFYNWPDLFYPCLLIIALFMGDLVGLIVLLFYPLSFYLKQRLIRQAGQKIAGYNKLKVIGITGSYGKTSVKELASELLARHFKIAKTEKNNNTEIGVAKTINKLNFAETQLFIVEMGAYKIGEIKRICDIANPNIGILTGINSQHSALFGGLDNIIKAKSEIISALPAGGTAILNYENEAIRQLALPDNIKKISYGFEAGADLVASKISFNNNRQLFTVSAKGGPSFGWKDQAADFSTQLIGRHNILNLLAAMAAALTLGLSLEEIKEDISKLAMVDQTLKLINRGRLILLDDSYNANPTGVISALEALSQFKQEKISVLDDILELGKETKKIHNSVAQALAKLGLAKIILVGKNYSRLLANYLKELNVPAEKILIEQSEITGYLKSLSGEKVILFEGRRARSYLKLFL